jgi:mannose-6-phosphate isomerase
MMYPMKFVPVYQEKIWGGNHLQTLFGRTLPNSKIGESWDLSSLAQGQSVISNGCYAGTTLNELTAMATRKFFGSQYQGTSLFPLLIKILDANDKLSVQVHPNDDAASRMNAGQGKTEAWYVLQAKLGAEIIYGLQPGTTKADFVQAMDNNILSVLQKVPVKAGDMIYVPAGRVHALCGGVVVYEVQQTSDTTYRLYDYDRVGADGKTRQLEVDKALAVINFTEQVETDFTKSIVTSPYFSMEKMTVDGELQLQTADHFVILCITSGSGQIVSTAGRAAVCQGETLLIPACLDTFSITGKIEFLKIV